MMKKVLFVAAVAMSLVFSGCMKEDDTYKKLKPVQPGLNIYTGAMNQNIVSMQQANFGLRLAMLVAEADKQQKTIDEVTVGSSNTLLKRQLNICQSLVIQGKMQYQKQKEIYGSALISAEL